MSFRELIDLVSSPLGGLVLGANDEFFAPKENLLLPTKPVFRDGEYTDRGKWMDGWETRRRRVPGHDHCVIKLGLAGVIRGFVVDTAFFRGNFPAECSIEGTNAPAHARYDDLMSDATEWTELLPRSVLAGDSINEFAVDVPWRFTHLRLHIYPDGGVARLRVHGEVTPDWNVVSQPQVEIDLAAVENGGSVIASSDMFFGSRHNLIMPGRGIDMGDGWETRRRRGPGFDWTILALGMEGLVRRVEVDTNHFKGNYPDSCRLEGTFAPNASPEDLSNPQYQWKPLLAQSKLQAHTRHFFVAELDDPGPITHVRFSIFPDGGVSRLRLLGTPTVSGRHRAGLERLNTLPLGELHAAFLRCCGASRWAEAMAAARPYVSLDELLAQAAKVDVSLSKEDWLQAFAAHPRIGDRQVLAERAKSWAHGEQAAAKGAADQTLDGLFKGNQDYEARFGYIYIVCATGKSAEAMLENLNARLTHAPEKELAVAAKEQSEISRLRLVKLIGGV